MLRPFDTLTLSQHLLEISCFLSEMMLDLFGTAWSQHLSTFNLSFTSAREKIAEAQFC